MRAAPSRLLLAVHLALPHHDWRGGPRVVTMVALLFFLSLAALIAAARRARGFEPAQGPGAAGLLIAVPGALRDCELFAKPVRAAFLPLKDRR